MVLEALTAALDELAGLEPSALADRDTFAELHRLSDRFEAVLTRAAGVFDSSGDWQLDNARTSAAWISNICHRPHTTTKSEIARARALRHLPHTEAAWLAGDIGAAQVKVLAHARRPATADQLAEDEAMLVDHATTMHFRHFTRLVAYWTQHADPDGEDEKARDHYEQRNFHLSQSFQGMFYADGTLDPINGTIVNDELSRLERELFEADWTDARHRLGREPTVVDLLRAPAQRRADALVEMAIRSASAPTGGRRPEPLFTVLVGWETFNGRICQLANGSVVAPGALVPWLKAAWIERIVFDSPSRVIDVGVTRRLFTGATRRAIEVRDQECFHPLCDEPAPQCQGDHIVPYAAGGPTTQDNGRMACGFHNRSGNQRPPPDPP